MKILFTKGTIAILFFIATVFFSMAQGPNTINGSNKTEGGCDYGILWRNIPLGNYACAGADSLVATNSLPDTIYISGSKIVYLGGTLDGSSGCAPFPLTTQWYKDSVYLMTTTGTGSSMDWEPFTQTGTYYARCSTFSGTRFASPQVTIINTSTTSIFVDESLEQLSVEFSNNVVSVSGSSSSKNFRLLLYDMSGRMVDEFANVNSGFKKDVSYLPQGIYVLRLTASNLSVAKKIAVN